MPTEGLTISRFAKQGGVSVETVRFYHRRGLLPIPKAKNTSFREYQACHIQQLRFIRQAQLAGFSLEEIKTLIQLDPVSDRLGIQTLAKRQLARLHEQIQGLQHVARNLQQLINDCEQSEAGTPCLIAKAFLE